MPQAVALLFYMQQKFLPDLDFYKYKYKIQVKAKMKGFPKMNVPAIQKNSLPNMDTNTIVFIDTEVSPQSGKILDYGAATPDGRQLHTKSPEKFAAFIRGCHYICGHNILAHDLHYLEKEFPPDKPFGREMLRLQEIIPTDTLYLSPLLFPCRPYHALVKDDKLQTEELNNPLNDAVKAKELFYDACNAYDALPQKLQMIFYLLLHERREFAGFFTYMRKSWEEDAQAQICMYFKGNICEHAKLEPMIQQYPVELAYCLALIGANDKHSVIPHWVHIHFPYVENIMSQLRSQPCEAGCEYCRNELDIRKRLKAVFGYEDFRTYDGEKLQEDAVRAAVRQESLLAVFPTGGGKSLTFQLPAFIAGDTAGELTVVISPLQSLMKDQVDNLEQRGIADAVTVNGLLSPLERAEALERVESGLASVLYISPEMLRSKTIERLLLSRSIARFVIDEAHCFSAWGQDFRVDYLYIGDFIRELQEKKGSSRRIPVSCFTATAKQKVISDIKDYFKQKLDIELRLFATAAERKNLSYRVIYKESDEEKYLELRDLIEQRNCPTIVYVSRTKRTWQLAEKLCSDGFLAKPFNGKMDAADKRSSQEAFIRDEIQVIVATSAFGMGVDKPNVKLVVHYDISDSLENYVQEAGRAGRDASLQAECYVLFNENDLDKHFILLNQTKLSISEIQQIWSAIKNLTGSRQILRRSPLELARQAGWDENVQDIETRVKAAIQALENAGYIQRGKNVPHVYASSILVPNMAEASGMIDRSRRMDERAKEYAKRILQMLISKRSIARAGNDEAESRIDYISDILGISKPDVIDSVNSLREEGILADTKDLTAYIKRTGRSKTILKKYTAAENFLIHYIDTEIRDVYENINLKELNEKALAAGIRSSSVNVLKTIFYFWTIKSYIKKSQDSSGDHISFTLEMPIKKLYQKIQRREDIAAFITDYLFERSQEHLTQNTHQNSLAKEFSKEDVLVLFSVLELKEAYEKQKKTAVREKEVEDALLFLSKTDTIRLEGGFLVLYNGLEVKRLEMNNKIRYKAEDYRQLNDFYQQKIQQIHIVGEYANMMVKDYSQALQFVSDYFQMDYRKFLRKYFTGERLTEIERNITPAKYNQLFHTLSSAQRSIIEDNESQYIVVAAAPGSGKTRVLVHKLASLLLLEDVRHEQLLMVTFSRAAATEFKQRLYELIGNAAAFVEIKTFHSYCFDLLGKMGKLEGADHIVADAAAFIRNGEAEAGKITKTVIVIDEAQDMDADAASLIYAMMDKNEDMRVIAVGDDDQNIYGFRGSDSKYLRAFIEEKGAVKYDLLENYRSSRRIVEFSNVFASSIEQRMKLQSAIPVQAQDGIVRLIRHTSENLEIPVVDNLLKIEKNEKGSKDCVTSCILTNTNEEALKVFGLLLKQGRKAKLIQSNDGFNLYHLAEIRFFLQMIKKQDTSPVIRDSLWESAKNQLMSRYAKSECLPICLNLLTTFEQLNQKKYRSDFEEFIRESKLEDFYQNDNKTVIVSTIHKSKGREFDRVFLLLNHMQLQNDEDRRRLYVGITRAKKELYVHYNSPCLDTISAPGMERQQDTAVYAPAFDIISQLAHQDVVLSFFKGKQREMLRLYSGMELTVDAKGLYNHGQKVVCFSKKYMEKMAKLNAQGYEPASAKIRFVVAWKGKTDTKECVILLPDIYYTHGHT